MKTLSLPLLFLAILIGAENAHGAEQVPSYDQTLAKARQLMDSGKLTEAYLAGSAAILLDEKRWEAYALVATVIEASGSKPEATGYLEKAMARAPEEKKAALERLREKLSQNSSSPSPANEGKAADLTGEARRKYDVLMLVIEDADKAKVEKDRRSNLLEFLAKSESFIRKNPKQVDIWALRAAAAVELEERFPAWEAGQRLIALGADNNNDSKIRRAIAMLDRKGWLAQKEWPKPGDSTSWENSLGMKFKRVGNALFCVWETREQDFEQFANATGYDATEGMWTQGKDGSKQRGATWKQPGFEQTPNHPVCGVSWDDSWAFCKWLTEKERAAGILSAQQSYRLPTDAEWSEAAGNGKYPWGDSWPPPQGAGNYADADSDINQKIKNYHDGFSRTAPVGSFSANAFGLYDLGGNLWEWCEDFYRKEMNSDEVRKEMPSLNDDGAGEQYRVLRGAAWNVNAPAYVSSACRFGIRPDIRNGLLGFRCVLVAGAGSRKL